MSSTQSVPPSKNLPVLLACGVHCTSVVCRCHGKDCDGSCVGPDGKVAYIGNTTIVKRGGHE